MLTVSPLLKIVRDVGADPQWRGWRQEYREAAWERSLSYPINSTIFIITEKAPIKTSPAWFVR